MILAKSHKLVGRQGFARAKGESATPNLWDGLAGLWAPAAGYSGITTLYDWSGNSNNGTLLGTIAATNWVQSPYGYVLNLDGTDDYVSVADHYSLDITPALTVHVTCYPTASGSSAFRTILSKRESVTPTNYQMYLSNAVGANAGVLSYYNGTAEYKSTEIPVVNTWNNLAATVLGTSLTLWINGKVVHTATLSAAPVANAGILAIGRPGSYTVGEYFIGYIAAAYVYRRTLSASEINQLNADPLAALRRKRVYVLKSQAVVGKAPPPYSVRTVRLWPRRPSLQ